MVEEAKNMVGICGLYCGTCPIYLVKRENDLDELRRISETRRVPEEDISCDGCHSDKLFYACIDCRHGFRRCAAEKDVSWCFECPDFPCQRLEAFRDVHVVNGISHHENVIEDLRYIKEYGIERFVEEQENKGRCPRCGKRLYWYSLECPRCNAQIKSLKTTKEGSNV
jgi:hypothetical protein